LLIPEGTINTKTKKIEEKLNKIINLEPEEAQAVQPIENNGVQYVPLAIAEPQPIRRTGRARNAPERLNL
jgi:hypothetical protein